MKIKCGRTDYFLKNTDLIMYNGICYQLITRNTISGSDKKIPIFAKSRAIKAIKEGLLIEVHLKNPPKRHSDIKYYSIPN